MKIAILVDDYYQVLEVWYPYLRLKEANFKTEFVGVEEKEYKSKEGYPAKAEKSIKEAQIKDYLAVIVPGGYAPDILRRHNEVNQFVKEMFKAGKLVAAICHGGWVPVSAGILKNKKATGFFSIKDDLVNAGAEFADEEVVVDSNLITSRNPYDLPAFCREIIAFLKKGEVR